MNKFDLSYSLIINSRVSPIWKKLVDPVSVKKWWNGATVKTDWQLNSLVEFEFSGEEKPRFEKGKIVELLENERLVLNLWSKDYGNEEESEPYKVVTYDLKYLGNDQSRITLTVSSFESEEEMNSRMHIVQSILNNIKQLVEI